MSRTKDGLEYFPLDVDFFDDEKIMYVSARYGLIGELITIKLLSRIYRNGYYITMDDEHILLLSKKFGINDIELMRNVINELVFRDFFDKEKYEKYHILTSRGIQKRYLEATKRRKESTICIQHVCNKGENVYISGENVNILSENVDIISDSKVKESKVKESKYGDVVMLTKEKYDILSFQYGERQLNSKIDDINNYCLSRGKRYKDYAATIRAWFKKDGVIPKSGEVKRCPNGHLYTGGICEQCI